MTAKDAPMLSPSIDSMGSESVQPLRYIQQLHDILSTLCIPTLYIAIEHVVHYWNGRFSHSVCRQTSCGTCLPCSFNTVFTWLIAMCNVQLGQDIVPPLCQWLLQCADCRGLAVTQGVTQLSVHERQRLNRYLALSQTWFQV